MALVSADSRIAELLTELHQLIKQTQEERSRSEHNLVNIQKTHERMQTENKISPYYRTKLRGLYTTAKADAEAECKVKPSLEDVTRSERRGFWRTCTVMSTAGLPASPEPLSTDFWRLRVQAYPGFSPGGMSPCHWGCPDLAWPL